MDASTCMIDFFCKNVAASSFCDDRKFALISRIHMGAEIIFIPTAPFCETYSPVAPLSLNAVLQDDYAKDGGPEVV